MLPSHKLYIVSARRSVLRHDHADQLIFLKKNLDKHKHTSTSLLYVWSEHIKIYNGQKWVYKCECTKHTGMDTVSEE